MGYDDLLLSIAIRSSGFWTILRRFVVACMIVRVHVLTRRQKKCIEGAVDDDIIAIAHDNNLRVIGDIVCLSQNV